MKILASSNYSVYKYINGLWYQLFLFNIIILDRSI